MGHFGINVGAAVGVVALLILAVLALAGACHGGVGFTVNSGFGH